MVAIAIVSPDPALLRKLEHLLRGEQGIRVIGVADNATVLLRLVKQHQRHPGRYLVTRAHRGVASSHQNAGGCSA